MKKYDFSVKLSKVDSTSTTTVSLTSENVQVQEITLAEIQQKFTVFAGQRCTKEAMNKWLGEPIFQGKGKLLLN